MSSIWGDRLKISVFGESHSEGIGVVIDGFPAGVEINFKEVERFMARRAPAGQAYSTKRKEPDVPQVVSGILNGVTCGTPICCVIQNTDTRSKDYENIALKPRPGHADYTGFVRYHGYNDPRGGGHFSGRLTAPLVFAGALCKQYLAGKGITVGAHIYELGGVADTPFDDTAISSKLLRALWKKPLPVNDDAKGEQMLAVIEQKRMEGDSVGGVVECAAIGLPAGLGSPIFGSVEGELSSLLFGIPAAKGVEFGAGFAAARMTGSEHNDSFIIKDGAVKTKTNRHGGILGGITSGMPLVFRAAFKPTPSISQEQQTVDLAEMKPAAIVINGRHDPCVVPRAVPCVEAAAAVALTNLYLQK
ncbi:chorismate synthase [Acetanaerobacterium elongatum]|uniref:Chorismate synthase n=1 Tax=Acetanaerobacterium elongatum TaxID=258515 RepID=A0A1H0EPL1_9FIRM|nr:chorismate synthase [Acetanaerobacterium elongatum]SDN84243.1 chorismate synthase [Acetanaerobacterium elongatum]